jgi:hypothetical protein
MVLRGFEKKAGACAVVVGEVAVGLSDGERVWGCTANPAKYVVVASGEVAEGEAGDGK